MPARKTKAKQDTHQGKPLYSSINYPAELGTKSWWQKMGYKPIQEDDCRAYARGGKNGRSYFPLYNRQQVQEINGEAAAECRDLYARFYCQWNPEIEAALDREIQIMLGEAIQFSPLYSYQPSSAKAKHSLGMAMHYLAQESIESFCKLYRPVIPGDEGWIVKNVLERIYGKERTVWKVIIPGVKRESFRHPLINTDFEDEASAYHALAEQLSTQNSKPEAVIDKHRYRDSWRVHTIETDGNKPLRGEIYPYSILDITAEIHQRFCTELSAALRRQSPKQIKADQLFTANLEKGLFPDCQPWAQGILARANLHVFDKYIYEIQAAGSTLFVGYAVQVAIERDRFQLLRLLALMTQWAINQYPFGEVPQGVSDLYTQIIGEAYGFPGWRRDQILLPQFEPGNYYFLNDLL